METADVCSPMKSASSRWERCCAVRRWRMLKAKDNAADVIGYRDSDVEDADVLKKLKDDYNWPLTDPDTCYEYDEPEDSKNLAAEWNGASGKYLSQAQLIDADAAAVRESRQKKLGNDARKRVSDSVRGCRSVSVSRGFGAVARDFW